nr:hypothetical protein [Tanacetum cinerariifolium]
MKEDRYSRKHEDQGPSPRRSSKKESEARFKRGDGRYDETDYDDDDQGSSPEISSRRKSKAQYTSVKKESSTPHSSRSHSNDNAKKVGRKTVVDQEPVVRKTKKTSSFSGARRDDESESDDDDYDGPRFDAGFDHVELEDAGKTFFPSPDKEADSHVWSPIKNTSNTKDRVKPARSVDHSVKSNLSDGPDSGSEPETVKSGFSGSYKFDSPRKQDFSRNSRTELDDLMQRSSSYHKQSDVSDTEEDLRFGTLAGSRRNKGNQKPHTKITSPSSKKPVEESQSPVKVNQASSFNSRPSRVEKKKPSVYKTSSESDSDDNDAKFPEKPSRSPFVRPNTYFSYGNDSDEEVSPPKHTPPSKAPLSPHGVSRRTKGQVEPKAKQSRVEPAEDLKTHPTSTVSPLKPQPHAARPKQEPPKRIPEPKVSKPEVSTPAAEVDNVKKPSHVHPKLPDFETLADRIYALNKMERQ